MNHIQTKSNWKLFYIWGFIFTVLFIAYWPALHIDYLFHDDFYYFNGLHGALWNKKHCDDYSEMHSFIHTVARPLGGYLRCAYGKVLNQIPDGKFIRAFNVFLLSIYCLTAFVWLRKCSVDKTMSLITVTLIGLLTSYQTPIAQITNAYHLPAATLALIALMLAERKLTVPNARISSFAAVFIIMACAFLIYPPAAMLYWSFLSVYVLFCIKEVNQEALTKLFKLSIPVLIAMVVPKLWTIHYGSDSRAQFSHDIIGKMQWFFDSIIPSSFTYWNVFPNVYYTASSLIIMGVAAILIMTDHVIINKGGYKAAINLLMKGLIGAGLVFMTFLPNMLVFESATNHRIIIAIKTILFLYAVFSLFTILVSRVLLILVAIPALVWATMTTRFTIAYYYAEPSHAEYAYMKEQLRNLSTKIEKNKTIYLVTSKIPYLTKDTWADEYGMPTSYWADDISRYALAITQEENIKPDVAAVLKGKQFIATKDKSALPAHANVIDMNMIHSNHSEVS